MTKPFCPRLDPQHAFAHEREVAELSDNLLRQDHWVRPSVSVTHARDEARVQLVDRVKVPEPGARGVIAHGSRAPRLSPEHPARLLERLAVLGGPGTHREILADLEVLVLGQDVPGAGLAAVVDPVVAVPAGPSPTDLNEERPDLLRRGLDGDGASGVPRRVRNGLVVWQRPRNLLLGSPPVLLPGTINQDICRSPKARSI